MPHPTVPSVLEVLARPRLVRVGREFAVAVAPGATRAAQVRQLEAHWELELGARAIQPAAQGPGAVEGLDPPRRRVDVFSPSDQPVGELGPYRRSFIRLADECIREYVDSELERRWPWLQRQPLAEAHPFFEPFGPEGSRP